MKKFSLILILVLAVTISAFAQSAAEKQALTDLHSATNGSSWVHKWDLSQPVSEWYGVTITEGKVTGLRLMFNNMEGNLPASLGTLTNLEKLELSFNKLTGQLPETLGQLTNLEVLAINGNDMNGQIPDSLGNLVMLKELHLSSNALEGQVPLGIGELRQLTILNLFDNQLSGNLPYNILRNNNLEQLVIAENDLTNTEAFADLMMFEDERETLFIEGGDIIPSAKKVMAIETSDDDN